MLWVVSAIFHALRCAMLYMAVAEADEGWVQFVPKGTAPHVENGGLQAYNDVMHCGGMFIGLILVIAFFVIMANINSNIGKIKGILTAILKELREQKPTR